MSRSDRILVAAGGGALVLALAAAWILVAPRDVEIGGDASALALASPAASAPPGGEASHAPVSTIVVDVEGAVAEPGIRELPAGSRVADALAAAGGYAEDVDLATTAAAINLAQPLTDGEQIRVPRLGDAAEAPAAPPTGAAGGGGGGGSGGDGLVNLNTASPEELEALPGIGPVTVQKIVAARQERPFTSLEDAQQRGVIHRGQLEDIRELATAG